VLLFLLMYSRMDHSPNARLKRRVDQILTIGLPPKDKFWLLVGTKRRIYESRQRLAWFREWSRTELKEERDGTRRSKGF
jgi:hypothetical protein